MVNGNNLIVSMGRTCSFGLFTSIIHLPLGKRSILNQYVVEHNEQLGEEVLNKYEKYQEQIDNNSKFRKMLEIEIGGLLLDMKSVIASDEKTRQLLDKVNDGQYELLQSTNE